MLNFYSIIIQDSSCSQNKNIIFRTYYIDKTITAKNGYNVILSDISGYVPIGAYYDSEANENVTSALCPRRRNTTNDIECTIYNWYEQDISTRGTLYVCYIKNYL